MIEKRELEKVELASDVIHVIEFISTQDQIDVLQIALDAMVAKKQLNSNRIKEVK